MNLGLIKKSIIFFLLFLGGSVCTLADSQEIYIKFCIKVETKDLPFSLKFIGDRDTNTEKVEENDLYGGAPIVVKIPESARNLSKNSSYCTRLITYQLTKHYVFPGSAPWRFSQEDTWAQFKVVTYSHLNVQGQSKTSIFSVHTQRKPLTGFGTPPILILGKDGVVWWPQREHTQIIVTCPANEPVCETRFPLVTNKASYTINLASSALL
jgi:hypothetical protein